MNILILDDDLDRQKKFQKALYRADRLGQVTTASNCIWMLQAEHWDCLFLDHDLGGETYVDSNNPNTGYQVARFLYVHPDLKPKRIIIHSLNAVGAKAMQDLLPGSELCPFAWEHTTLISK